TLVAGNTLWDTVTGVKKQTLKMRELEDGFLKHLVFSRDGKTIVTTSGSDDTGNVLCLWDTATGARIRRIALPGGATRFVAFLPDGQTLLETDGLDVCFRDAATGQAKSAADLRIGKNPVRLVGRSRSHGQDHRAPMCLSADGKLLADARDG